jgi:hypothetical protein
MSNHIRTSPAGLALLIALLLALLAAAPAQAQRLEQALLDGGSGFDAGNSIAVDGAGNRYVAGTFQGTASFGDGAGATTLSSRGGSDVFVAKYAPSGALIWARQIGGPEPDGGFGVAVARDGAVYATGDFRGTARFDGAAQRVERTSRGANDAFVARYRADGTLEWANQIGGVGGDFGSAVAADRSGNAVLTGGFTEAALVSDIDQQEASRFQGFGGIDVLVVKYNLDGQLGFATAGSGGDNGSGLAIALDRSDAIYVTGEFSGVMAFFSESDILGVTSAGGADVFVARLSPSGAARYVVRSGGAGDDAGTAIAVDTQQQAHVAGRFAGEARFGTLTLRGGGNEAFLMKLDSGGVVLRGVRAGGAGDDVGRGVALAPDRSVYLAGSYEGAATLGQGSRALNLPPVNDAANTQNGFVAAFDSNLVPTFAEGIGGSAGTRNAARGIVVSSADGLAHVTGDVDQRATFGAGARAQTLATAGKSDSFLATFGPGGSEAPPAPAPSPTPPVAPSPTPGGQVFYISSTSGGSVDGISFAEQDVLAYNPATDAWTMLIDGSDIGLGATDLKAFEWRPDGTQIMGFNGRLTLPGIAATVEPNDLVRFIPSRLGTTTQGRFELFFDGSDVGLSTASEAIDGAGFLPDGRLVISTIGAAQVPGATGTLSVTDRDLLVLSGGQLGEATQGSWELFFAGGPSGFDTNEEDIHALTFISAANTMVVGTVGAYRLRNDLNGDADDLLSCKLASSSSGLECGATRFFDGDAARFGTEIIDAFAVGESGVLGDIGNGGDSEAGPPEDPGDGLNDGAAIFLPLLQR